MARMLDFLRRQYRDRAATTAQVILFLAPPTYNTQQCDNPTYREANPGICQGFFPDFGNPPPRGGGGSGGLISSILHHLGL